jgi:peptidoglycan LD-endopeptidase LytH
MERNWRSGKAGWRIVGMIFGCLMLTFFTLMSSKGASSVIQQPIEPENFAPKPSLNSTEDLENLRQRKLLFPLQGFTSQGIKDSFNEERGHHRHEAIDILAPRNTPVVAVEAGKIARLWYSQYGGITIYQFDPTATYAYYYAHLERYADNLKEHDWVERGQVIGYVGTSGNAPKETPHLHFSIFKLTAEKNWWQGSAINPYEVFSTSHPF